MKVGIFADTHDHLDNIRRVVKMFNDLNVDCVLFAGQLIDVNIEKASISSLFGSVSTQGFENKFEISANPVNLAK